VVAWWTYKPAPVPAASYLPRVGVIPRKPAICPVFDRDRTAVARSLDWRAAATRRMAGSEDVVLLDAPKDGITTVRFGPSGHLLATSWDTLAHVYDITTNARIATLTTPAPLLDGTWTSATAVAVGGLDKTVRA